MKTNDWVGILRGDISNCGILKKSRSPTTGFLHQLSLFIDRGIPRPTMVGHEKTTSTRFWVTWQIGGQ